jgi:transcriptional regulator with XRE-family HTH domain
MAHSGRSGVNIDPDLLRAAREGAGMSMAELARRVDLAGSHLTRQRIWQYENERGRPSPQVLQLVAQALDKPAEWFVRQEEPRTVTLLLTYVRGPLGGSLRVGVKGVDGPVRAIAPLHLLPQEWMALRTLTGSPRLQVEFDEVGS